MVNSVSPLYNYELYFHWVTMAILWPLYIMQVLALRFTPKRRLLATRVQLIGIGILGCAIQSIRSVDPSSAFGRLDLMTQRSLYGQLGQILMYAVVLVVVATCRTLCVQLNRTLPIIFVRTIWGINITSHIIAVSCIIPNALFYTQGNQNGLMKVFATTLTTFVICSLLTLLVYWIAFINLRKKIEAFLVSLQQQEETRRKTAEQLRQQLSPGQSPAATTASIDIRALQTRKNTEVSSSSHERPEVSTLPNSPAQPTNMVAVRVSPSSPPPPPTAARSPSHHRSPTTATASIAHAAPSQSDTRLNDLHSAVRKMNILTILLTILLIGTALSQLQSFLEYVKGDVMTDVVMAPRDDGSGSYRMGGAITSIVNQLGLFATIWYAWTNPKIWLASARKEFGMPPFWATVRYGPREAAETTRTNDRHMSKTGNSQKEKVPMPKTLPTLIETEGGGANAVIATSVKRPAVIIPPPTPSQVGGGAMSPEPLASPSVAGAQEDAPVPSPRNAW